MALCRLLLSAARPAAARRADQPPRRRVGGLARAPPRGVPGHRRRRDPRPLLPRQRRRLDPRARPRPRASPSRATTPRWLEQKQARLGAGGAQGERRAARTIAAELEWVRDEPQGPAQEVEGPPERATRRCSPRTATSSSTTVQIHIPPGRGSATSCVEAEHLRKGFGDRLLIEDLSFSLPRGGHRRRDRPQRRRQDDAVPHDHRARSSPTTARCASATPSSSPTSTSPATRSTPTRPSGRRSPGGDDQIKVGEREMNSRAYVGRLQLQGLRPAEARSGNLSGGERNRAAPGQAAAPRRQPAAARRADQRPRRRHAARARGGAARLRRLRGGDLPRPLVPGPRRHPRARLRGRLAGALVRGQLRGLRGAPPRAARRRGRPPAPHHVQAARPG